MDRGCIFIGHGLSKDFRIISTCLVASWIFLASFNDFCRYFRSPWTSNRYRRLVLHPSSSTSAVFTLPIMVSFPGGHPDWNARLDRGCALRSEAIQEIQRVWGARDIWSKTGRDLQRRACLRAYCPWYIFLLRPIDTCVQNYKPPPLPGAALDRQSTPPILMGSDHPSSLSLSPQSSRIHYTPSSSPPISGSPPSHRVSFRLSVWWLILRLEYFQLSSYRPRSQGSRRLWRRSTPCSS